MMHMVNGDHLKHWRGGELKEVIHVLGAYGN